MKDMFEEFILKINVMFVLMPFKEMKVLMKWTDLENNEHIWKFSFVINVVKCYGD